MKLITRRRFLAGLGASALGGVGFATYATAYEAGYALKLTTYDLTPPLWPDEIELKIAVIADIHACYPWMSDERIGEIVEADPPRRLVIRWQNQMNPEFKAEGDSLCTIELEAMDGAVKLSITHTLERAASKYIGATAFFWPQILSNLKSLVETGSIVLTEPLPVR